MKIYKDMKNVKLMIVCFTDCERLSSFIVFLTMWSRMTGKTARRYTDLFIYKPQIQCIQWILYLCSWLTNIVFMRLFLYMQSRSTQIKDSDVLTAVFVCIIQHVITQRQQVYRDTKMYTRSNWTLLDDCKPSSKACCLFQEGRCTCYP